MTQTEAALQIFCAMLVSPEAVINMHPNLGEKQVRTAFELAKTFLMVSKEVDPIRKPDPNVKLPARQPDIIG